MNQPIMSLDQYVSQITQQLRTSIKAACIMYGDAEALAEVESQLTPVLTEIEDKLTELHAVPGDDTAVACHTCNGSGEITVRGQEVECSRCKGSGFLPPENPKG